MADKNREPKPIDVVSQDKDWRSVIENELRCQENWQKDWGFLADNSVSENPRTKAERIQVLEEKLKSMSDVKIESVSRTAHQGGNIDILNKAYNKRKTNELMPQTRRPQALSKAYKFLVEQGVIEDNGKKKK
jgi:hypothetical protein